MNYAKALREFENYLGADPEDRKSDEVMNWVSALRELERREKEASGLKERIKTMTWEREGQQRALAQQGSRIQELHDAAERLQGRVGILEKENRSLGEVSRNLKEENEKVKDTLEKLRALDRQMEEKRRSIR
jgi:chromosome segregation ATPase